MLFATPGLIYESIAERRRPVLQLSPLREASRIALTSVIFSGAALCLLALGRAWRPAWLPDPGSLLADPSRYLADHYRLVLRALVGQVAIASALALTAALVRYGTRPARQRPFDVMWTVFHESTSGRSRPYLDVLTADGVWLKGALAAFDVTGAIADRFIALRAPIRVRRQDETEATQLPAGWERSIIPFDRIAEMHVAFAPAEDEQVEAGRWRAWWRARPRLLNGPTDRY